MSGSHVLRFRSLGIEVEVYSDDREVAEQVWAVAGTHAPSTGEPTLRYRLETAPSLRVLRDGATVRECPYKFDLALAFEYDLYCELIARSANTWFLHGAALSDGQSALIMVGASGAGKSTMSQALLARGARYITDEYLTIDRDDMVRGVARPLNFDEPLLRPPPPGWQPVHQPVRALDGRVVDYTLLHPPTDRICHEPQPLGAIVLLRHAPHEPAGARRVASGPALQGLWSQCQRPEPDALALAAGVLQRHAVYEVTTRELDEACEHIAALWREARVRPAAEPR